MRAALFDAIFRSFFVKQLVQILNKLTGNSVQLRVLTDYISGLGGVFYIPELEHTAVGVVLGLFVGGSYVRTTLSALYSIPCSCI